MADIDYKAEWKTPLGKIVIGFALCFIVLILGYFLLLLLPITPYKSFHDFSDLELQNKHVELMAEDMRNDGYWVRIVENDGKLRLKGQAMYFDNVKLMSNYDAIARDKVLSKVDKKKR